MDKERSPSEGLNIANIIMTKLFARITVILVLELNALPLNAQTKEAETGINENIPIISKIASGIIRIAYKKSVIVPPNKVKLFLWRG